MYECIKFKIMSFICSGKIDKVRDAVYGNTATTSTKASPSFNSRERDMYDEHEVRTFKIKLITKAQRSIVWINRLVVFRFNRNYSFLAV